MSTWAAVPHPRRAPDDAPALSARRNGLAVAALCCGITGILIGLIPLMFLGAAALAALAIVLGVAGLRRVRRRQADNRGRALAGVAAGVLAAVTAIIGAVIMFSATATLNSDLDTLHTDLRKPAAAQAQAALRTAAYQEHEIIREGLFVGNM